MKSKNNFENLTDAQKMNFISLVCGNNTTITGGAWGNEEMRYRIVPQHKLIFMIKDKEIYASEEEELKFIADILTFVAFVHNTLKQEFPEGKILNEREKEKKATWQSYLNLPTDVRSPTSYSSEHMTNISEDDSFISSTASDGIDAFFSKLLEGKWFLYLNSKEQTITINKLQDAGIRRTSYELPDDHRSIKDDDMWKHLKNIYETVDTVMEPQKQ